MTSLSSMPRRLTGRRFILVLAAVAIAALLIRLVVCWELRDTPSVRTPAVVTDMATYQRLGREIAAGDWPDHFDYQPFYYSLFLPLFYRFCGDGAWAIMLAQALLGAGAVWLTGLAAARLYGRRAGIAAAVLLALSRFHVFYTPFLLLEVLSSFWMSLLLLAGLQSWRRNRWLDWLLTAVIAAAAALTRGNALLMLPGILASAAWRNRRKPWRAVAIAAATIAIFYAPQMPFAWKNRQYTGRWCGASTAGDKVLALGNTPEAPPGGLEYPLTYHDWCAQAERRPEDGRISVPTQILRRFKREPLQVIELKFRAFLLFWHRQEIANNINISLDGRASRLLSWPVLLPFAVIGTLAVIGMLTATRASPQRLLLTYMILAYCFGTVMFYILARFRIGALPLLCVAAGAGIDHFLRLPTVLRRLAPDARRQSILGHGLAIVIAIFLVNAAFSTYQDSVEAAFMRRSRPAGVAVVTADTVRVYDHGPLSVGGMTIYEVPASGIRIEKRLLLPVSSISALGSDEKRQLLPTATVRLPVQASRGAIWSGSLEHQGRSYSFGPETIRTDRFITWLEATIPELYADQDGVVTVTATIIPRQGSIGFGADRLRDYGRTSYQELATGNALPINAEAGIEIDFKL